MRILNIALRRGQLHGTIRASGLPPHDHLHVGIALFRVGTEMPKHPSEYQDIVEVKGFYQAETWPLQFVVKRRAGDYFIAVNLIVAFDRAGKNEAQIEWFYPMTDPCSVVAGEARNLELVIQWPAGPAPANPL